MTKAAFTGARILLVDDDPQSLESTRKILELEGYVVECASDGDVALERLRPSAGGEASAPDLVLTDLRMPKLDGLELLRAAVLVRRDLPLILMTAYGRVEDAVEAMKLGAVDFLMKPFKRKDLLSAVGVALSRVSPPKASAPAAKGEDRLLGASSAIEVLRAMAARVAEADATVLITGESGTGKELVARTLHRCSGRAERAFVALNCAALPEALIESELFGYEKGAFSGALSAKPGLFEAAHGGTLFLDEVGDMPPSVQAKLLRVLQEREVRRIGATRSRAVDVRVLSATHRDLRAMVAAGTFREDLLFRLEVIALPVPALRDRREDVPELVSHFLRGAAFRHSRSATEFSEEALQILCRHSWPGNVRELANVVERAVVLSQTPVLGPELLPAPLLEAVSAGEKGMGGRLLTVPIGTPLREMEELMIRRTLEATSGDKNMTAKLLGINSRTIYRKLEKRGEPEAEA